MSAHLCFTDGGVGVQELLHLPVMFFISVELIVVFMVTININNVISMVLIVIKMLRIRMLYVIMMLVVVFQITMSVISVVSSRIKVSV